MQLHRHVESKVNDHILNSQHYAKGLGLESETNTKSELVFFRMSSLITKIVSFRRSEGGASDVNRRSDAGGNAPSSVVPHLLIDLEQRKTTRKANMERLANLKPFVLVGRISTS